jgi:hypothetical protein
VAPEQEGGVFRPNGVSYLRVPSNDPKATAAFYATVFGWKVDADREDPSFEDGTGHVIGHIHGDMEVSGEAGIRPYVYVDSVPETLERVRPTAERLSPRPMPRAISRSPSSAIRRATSSASGR